MRRGARIIAKQHRAGQSGMQLDHIFIMCDVDAPEAAALTTFGLVVVSAIRK
jgi:hypothetical protein